MEKFRQNGLSMPGQSLANHFRNCLKAYGLLLADLFDAIHHFAQSREAPDVGLALSSRVFEANGAFEQHLGFQNAATSSLNQLLMLNPAFAAVMEGSNSNKSSKLSGGGGNNLALRSKGKELKSGGKEPKGATKFQWMTGQILRFGKGTDGPQYDVKAIIKKLKETSPGFDSSNFCALQYLSNKKLCTSKKHESGKFHVFSPEVSKLRQSFESHPYRLDKAV